MYQQQVNAVQENQGISPEDYKNLPLPEDYEITQLLGDVISVEYLDTAEDGKSLIRNGIVLPGQIVDNRAWRIARVMLVGPDCKTVKKGDTVIFPGDRGLQALQRNGKLMVFLSENRIFGICEPINFIPKVEVVSVLPPIKRKVLKKKQ
jgi:co-chaperonin GroES (HSP10)